MSPWTAFAWGFAGSVAVEVIALLGYYYADPVRLPQRYRRVGFWITRLTLAVLAGALAVGYDIDQKILAFNIGAATPLIVTSLARGLRPGDSSLRTAVRSEPEQPAESPPRHTASGGGRR